MSLSVLSVAYPLAPVTADPVGGAEQVLARLDRALVAAGAPGGSLFARHVEEVDRLITGWRGQRAINLPGKVEARRQGGRLVLRQG